MGVDVELLDRLTAAISGACPCGGNPRDDSIYCSYDCEPNHVSVHTDQRETGEYATPMRWRPDLVTAVDDSGLTLLAQRRRGPCNAQVFDRGDLIHLRLDDGHRFVGVDVEPGDEQMPCDYWDRPNWAALERELGNSRHVEADPWADVMRDYIERVDRYVLSDVETRFGLQIQSTGIRWIAPPGLPVAGIGEAIERLCQSMRPAFQELGEQLGQSGGHVSTPAADRETAPEPHPDAAVNPTIT